MNNKIKANNSKFSDIKSALNIDESNTQNKNKQKVFNKFVTSVVPEPNFNYQADLLYFPTTAEKYKYLLVVTDLATNKFDIEPLKTTKAEESTNALKAIIDRGILTLPEISIKTDGGAEFKGAFHNFLLKHGIYHGTAMAHRKTQMAPVERLNRDLARLFVGYMNQMEKKTKQPYWEWTDVIDTVRSELNRVRERDIDKLKEYQEEHFFDTNKPPKFKEGDVVQYVLQRPVDVRGLPIKDAKFRVGDRRWSIDSRRIVSILYYPDEPYCIYDSVP